MIWIDADCKYGKRVWKNFEIYELDPACFLSAPGLAWQAYLKKTEVEVELLTDIDMLLMIKKGIRRGICYSINQHIAANNNYMKNFDKDNKIITNYVFKCK